MYVVKFLKFLRYYLIHDLFLIKGVGHFWGEFLKIQWGKIIPSKFFASLTDFSEAIFFKELTSGIGHIGPHPRVIIGKKLPLQNRLLQSFVHPIYNQIRMSEIPLRQSYFSYELRDSPDQNFYFITQDDLNFSGVVSFSPAI